MFALTTLKCERRLITKSWHQEKKTFSFLRHFKGFGAQKTCHLSPRCSHNNPTGHKRTSQQQKKQEKNDDGRKALSLKRRRGISFRWRHDEAARESWEKLQFVFWVTQHECCCTCALTFVRFIIWKFILSYHTIRFIILIMLLTLIFRNFSKSFVVF